ncbi:helix-turn-helix domain-containing protein [Corynebacterium glyciniphilum]|uniref:helix-turn-helix domain-containing protein n=1 Tax=Corynebacterium glyciniphilum TaxID=1404244 RepID=UPI003FD352FA
MVRNPLTESEIEAGRRIGQVLRDARNRADRTLAAVAAEAGISAETLRKIETGRLPSPAFGTVVRLCTALELDVRAMADAWERRAAGATPAV